MIMRSNHIPSSDNNNQSSKQSLDSSVVPTTTTKNSTSSASASDSFHSLLSPKSPPTKNKWLMNIRSSLGSLPAYLHHNHNTGSPGKGRRGKAAVVNSRAVRFDMDATIEHVNDIPLDDYLDAMWFTNEELEERDSLISNNIDHGEQLHLSGDKEMDEIVHHSHSEDSEDRKYSETDENHTDYGYQHSRPQYQGDDSLDQQEDTRAASSPLANASAGTNQNNNKTEVSSLHTQEKQVKGTSTSQGRQHYEKRGLEHIDPKCRVKRRKDIFHARTVVFQNQHKCDGDKLAKLYHNTTKSVERDARRVGISDAKAVGMDPWHHYPHRQSSISPPFKFYSGFGF